MDCDEVRHHWELYYDSEGDSELYLQINEHLAACQSCAKWFFQQTQFEDAVTAKLAAAEPTAGLWQRVLFQTGVAEPTTARGWSFFGPLFALAASLALVVGIWQFLTLGESVHLSALTAAVHQELAEGAQPVAFASTSDEAVERYLKRRVTFPVRCPPRRDAGFEVRGGGVCEIAGESAAYVLGQVDNKDVSIFILPAERVAQFVHEREVLGREAIHHCREGKFEMVLAKIDKNIVVVIGQGSPAELERVVRAYGTYPEQTRPDAA